MDFFTPEVFDALIITNIVVGVLIIGRKFYKDVTGPLPDDTPRWMREKYNPISSSSPSSDSDS
jgi:hypothetical protein